jgi:hypothetical protein
MITLLGNLRQEKLKLYVQISNYLNENICEVGVYKGGSFEYNQYNYFYWS